MDIVGPFNITKNNNNQTAESVSGAFIKRFICVFGCLKIVLTDRGANFTSKMMKQITRRFKFDKIETTAFSPQSNSSLERAHHPLFEYLEKFSTKKYEWDELLDFAQFHYNTSVHMN